MIMKSNTVLKTTFLAGVLAVTSPALAHPDPADLIEKANANQAVAEANLSTSVINGKGTITYNGDVVWQGPVKNDLKAFSKVTTSNENGQQENIEYAAAWDGDKLVWENTPGAGAALEPERKKQEQQLEDLKRQLPK